MIRFVAYDSTGLIVRTGLCQKELVSLQAAEGEISMEGVADNLLDYVDIQSLEIKKRPSFEISVSEGAITDVPFGASVFVDGELVGTCETGQIEIEKASKDDEFRVRLELFPYLPEEVVI